jgi:glycine/D-amino acid oxidase-like deaminating enzyme
MIRKEVSMIEESENREVIVIGGGLMGSSVAWHLAKAGINVLLS